MADSAPSNETKKNLVPTTETESEKRSRKVSILQSTLLNYGVAFTIINLIWIFVAIGSTIAVFARLLIVKPNTIGALLVSDFFQWNGVSFTNTLANLAQLPNVESYKVITLLLVSALINGIASLIRTIWIRRFETANQIISKPGEAGSAKKKVTERGVYFVWVKRGISLAFWLEWMINGPVYLWALSGLGTVYNFALLINIVIMQIASGLSFWIFQDGNYWYRKYSKTGILVLEESNIKKVLAKAFGYYGILLPWVVGTFLQLVIWLTIIFHAGYAINSNPVAFSQFRLIILIINGVFIFIIPCAIQLIVYTYTSKQDEKILTYHKGGKNYPTGTNISATVTSLGKKGYDPNVFTAQQSTIKDLFGTRAGNAHFLGEIISTVCYNMAIIATLWTAYVFMFS